MGGRGLSHPLILNTCSLLPSFINRQTKTEDGEVKRFLGVLDIFGFEDFEKNSFEQLLINWTNEKLHLLFNKVNFEEEMALYEEEGITSDVFHFVSNQPCIDLLEKVMQGENATAHNLHTCVMQSPSMIRQA